MKIPRSSVFYTESHGGFLKFHMFISPWKFHGYETVIAALLTDYMKMYVVEVGLVVFAVDLTLISAVVRQLDIVDDQTPRVHCIVVSHSHSRVADERK